ncbi:hypothetical protein [Flagellimonas onchidii]|uniref:hypothetical protein n=1 Tax=Flagellimonas onchidii TaxID=2562684 RepID=UPI0010A5F441|nr:hypothetical protein [Allomuricauda onchidii]
MTVLQLLLKVASHFNLSSTEERQTMLVDIKAWEAEATPTSDNKIKAMYGKLHQGVFMRMACMFGFFFLVRWFKDMISDNDDPFEDD